MSSNQPLRDAVIAIAESVGMTVDDSAEPKPYVWSGRVLASGVLSAGEILHEVAHYLCAPRSRRSRPEYGLGKSVEGTRTPKMRVSGSHASREEHLASVLGIAMEFHLGLHWEDTYRLHSWDEDPADAFFNAMVLTERGLLVHGKPAVLLYGSATIPHPTVVDQFTSDEIKLLGARAAQPIAYHRFWDRQTPRDKCCGYCGSPEPSVEDDYGSWPYCPDCQGV